MEWLRAGIGLRLALIRRMDNHAAPSGRRSARSAGLRYTQVDSTGLSRVRRGRGFVYRSATGRVVRDPRTLNRIRALVVPPAWKDVWISPDPIGHLQATGRDARGRKQYLYHPLWRAERDATKYDRLLAFADVLPAVRQQAERDLRQPKGSRRRVLATVVALLERTHIRIGNEEYARSNKSHGLTTMRDRHVKIRGAHLDFNFRGKSGVHQSVELDDARLAKAVRECQDLPGQTLFQYVDEEGGVKAVTSSDVNEYLKNITGGEFTAKDFRTWAGTLATARELDRSTLPATVSARDRTIVAAVDRVAEELGNTRAVCRRNYVHPAVIDAYRAGLTIGRLTAPRRASTRKLRQMEGRLVALLLRMDQKKAA